MAVSRPSGPLERAITQLCSRSFHIAVQVGKGRSLLLVLKPLHGGWWTASSAAALGARAAGRLGKQLRDMQFNGVVLHGKAYAELQQAVVWCNQRVGVGKVETST